jgi:hypothetical protein
MISPYDAWVLRGLLIGRSLNGELQAVSTPFHRIAEHLASLTEGRQAAWEGYLAGRDDAAKIIATLANVDLAGLAPEPSVAPPPGTKVGELLCLADVKLRDLEWLWPGRIPLGTLTTYAGDPGLGKSFLTLDDAARVSQGEPWPDCPDTPNPAGQVILFSAEDDLETTVVPRLRAAGARLENLYTLTTVVVEGKASPFTLEHVNILEEKIRSLTNPRLVVIDPVSAYLGRTDDHRNACVRALLAPLAKLAADYRIAIITVTHMNKANTTKALNKIMGSLAHVAAARSVWACVKDKAERHKRLFLPVKNNLGPEPTGLRYWIDPDSLRVVWDSQAVDMHADDAFKDEDSHDRKSPEMDKAREFLRRVVGPGPIRAVDMHRQRESEGLSEETIKRAKKKENIESFKGPDGWYWRYRPVVQGEGGCVQGSQEDQDGHEDQVGQEGPETERG